MLINNNKTKYEQIMNGTVAYLTVPRVNYRYYQIVNRILKKK